MNILEDIISPRMNKSEIEGFSFKELHIVVELICISSLFEMNEKLGEVWSFIFSSIGALEMAMSVCRSVGLSVGLSVGPHVAF